MDRFAAMILLLGALVSAVLLVSTLFVVAPVVCSCIFSLLYSLYLFMAYEDSGVHHAQEFENRFWTLFAMLLTTALVFATDSPLAFGLVSPQSGLAVVLLSGYLMHLWDRYQHRQTMSRPIHNHRRSSSQLAALAAVDSSSSSTKTSTTKSSSSSNSTITTPFLATSLKRLQDLGIPVEESLLRINECLKEIDQLLIPSTINNFINQRYVLSKEREIINVFEDCDARALNYLISHVKLGLLFYKIKDHRNFNGKHRTELINLLAVERLSILTVMSRVILLHSLQLLKLRANPQAEYWVRNIILNTHQDDLSELKSLTDSKGDYFCMPKLIYDDIRSETVRQDVLKHIRKEAAVQRTYIQMGTRRFKTKGPHGSQRGRNQHKYWPMQWRKVLSDVDDTLYCSGGMYPAGVDRRFSRKTVYPGVLAFYRELDVGTTGPEEWDEKERHGNLVFLSARPHVYKDMSEKANYAKFEKLRARGGDGRQGMHTTPSLLAGDLASGGKYMVTNDFEPLAKKKFDNFRRFVSIYPEFQHVFICDNGQGDVRAGEMMFDSFPYEFEALYVHIVCDIAKTHGYAPERWRQKEFRPIFFRTYPEAALHAASKRNPPLIRVQGLQRICSDAVKDFIQIKQWPSDAVKAERRVELNQSVWEANQFLKSNKYEPVTLIPADRKWETGEKVRTPYGMGTVCDFDPTFDLYTVELDWRPLNCQVEEHRIATAAAAQKKKKQQQPATRKNSLETVPESEEASTSTAKKAESQPIQSSTSAADIEHPDETCRDPTQESFPVKAQIGGKFLTKYTPPTMPQFERQQRSLFTFWTTSSSMSSSVPSTPAAEGKVPVPVGDQCSTPYGAAEVVEYRKSSSIVVVSMLGWKATAYLDRKSVKPITTNLLKSLLKRLSISETSTEQKADFPFSEGTRISTPFGNGHLIRAIVSPRKVRSSSDLSRQAPTTVSTVAIELTSWKLAHGQSPVVYCTPETARTWRDRKTVEGKNIFSALETLVSSSRNLLEPFLLHKEPPAPPKFVRYFRQKAAVSTLFGPGVIESFREDDGFYHVSLVGWKLANGKHPVAYLKKDDITTRIAKGCQEGYPVLTSLGVSGMLASVEPTTGVHIVTIPSSGMVCYLQPESVIEPLKAAVREDVSTAYGEGTIISYDRKSRTYKIVLHGWGGFLFAKGDTFERVGDGIQDRDGSFGVKWLLRFLFFSSDSTTTSATRSRSNSLVSGS